jgi:cell division protein FtsQ
MASARPFLVAASVAALGGLTAWLVYGTSVLGVDQVRIVGSGFIGDPAIRSAARLPMGTALASVDTDAVATRVEKLPGVARARVRRDWPDAIVIDVTCRTAVAATPVGEAYVLIDAGGVAFRTVDSRPDVALITLAHPGPHDLSTRAALAVLASLPAALRSQLVSMSATTSVDVTLTLVNRRTVIWGDASDNATKGRVAITLLRQPGTVIDVSAPNVVTVR